MRKLSRFEQFVRDNIRFEYRKSHLAQHRRYRALPARYPAGESHFQHMALGAGPGAYCPATTEDFPRRSRAAFTVLLISMVIVTGPTPPGTGESAPAVNSASGCTSPINTLPLARNFSNLSGKFFNSFSASSPSVT